LEGEIALKACFPSSKTGRRGFITDFLTGALLNQFRAGWRAVWLSIIIGGGYLDTLCRRPILAKIRSDTMMIYAQLLKDARLETIEIGYSKSKLKRIFLNFHTFLSRFTITSSLILTMLIYDTLEH